MPISMTLPTITPTPLAVRNLSGLQRGSRPAELGMADVHHGRRPVPHHGSGIGDRAYCFIGDDVDATCATRSRWNAAADTGNGCSRNRNPISSTRGRARIRSEGAPHPVDVDEQLDIVTDGVTHGLQPVQVGIELTAARVQLQPPVVLRLLHGNLDNLSRIFVPADRAVHLGRVAERPTQERVDGHPQDPTLRDRAARYRRLRR